jgi:hypothetical protein
MGEEPQGEAASTNGAADAGAEGGLGSVLYKVALAGVGALILAQEELEAAWRRARGERADGEPSTSTGEAPAPSVEAGGEASPGEAGAGAPDGNRLWTQVDAAIGRFLRGLSIPTRDEIDALSSKVDELAARIDAHARRPD